MIRLVATILLFSATASATFFPNTNVTQFGNSNVVTGTGTGGAGIPRFSVATDSNAQNTSGTITTTCSTPTTACPANSFLALSVQGAGSAQAVISGTFTGATMNIDGTVDGTNWVTLLTASGATGTYSSSSFSTTGKYRVLRTAALVQIRVRASALSTGSVSVVMNSDIPLNAIEVVQLNAANLNGQMVGDSAAGAADSSSNPVKVGAKYNATMPVLTDGNRTDLQTNRNGALSTSGRWTHSNIHGASAGTTVHSGALTLHAICVNTQSGGTITVYDNTSVTGSAIYTITTASGTSGIPNCMGPLDDEFSTGLEVVTVGGSTDVTFLWR